LGIGDWEWKIEELSKNAPCLPHFPYLLTANFLPVQWICIVGQPQLLL
jgi:hypothetical protein